MAEAQPGDACAACAGAGRPQLGSLLTRTLRPLPHLQVLNAVDLPYLDQFEQVDFMPFDPTIKRTEGTLKGPDGKVFKTTKGEPGSPPARPPALPHAPSLPKCLPGCMRLAAALRHLSRAAPSQRLRRLSTAQ